MDNSNVFHSDYMLKLYYIGEQIGDEKFEQILDKVLAETNLLPQVPKYSDVQSQLSKISWENKTFQILNNNEEINRFQFAAWKIKDPRKSFFANQDKIGRVHC